MRYILLLLSLAYWECSSAQLRLTKAEIVANKGTKCTTGITKDGRLFLSYLEKKNDATHGEYMRVTSFYLDKNGICDLVQIIEPKYRLAGWIESFDKSYSKIDNLIWEDKEFKSILTIDHNDETVIINEAPKE